MVKNFLEVPCRRAHPRAKGVRNQKTIENYSSISVFGWILNGIDIHLTYFH